MTTTTRKLKKGDKVADLRPWDNAGTFTIRRAVVHSCGPKVLRLTDALTGEMFKVAYSPGSSSVVADADDATLVAEALGRAAQFLLQELRHFTNCLARHQDSVDAGYRRSIQRSIEALHEPRAEWRQS